MSIIERQLTGIFVRWQNPDTGKWENKDIHDLPWQHTLDWIDRIPEKGRDKEGFIIRMMQRYFEVLREVAELTDITKKGDDDGE
jgi:hypothetical protein